MSRKVDSLRNWIHQLHDGTVTVRDDTDLIESGLVSSLQFVSMVIEIERLHGERLQPHTIQVDSMRSLQAIDRSVFQGS